MTKAGECRYCFSKREEMNKVFERGVSWMWSTHQLGMERERMVFSVDPMSPFFIGGMLFCGQKL